MFIIVLVIGLLCGLCGRSIAEKRNRSTMKWFWVCFLMPIFGLFTLIFSNTLDYEDEELGISAPDSLGTIMLFISLTIFVLQLLLKV